MEHQRLKIIFYATKDIKKRVSAWRSYCEENERCMEDRLSDDLLYHGQIDKDFIDLGYSAIDVGMPSFAKAFEHLYEDIWEDMVWKEIEYQSNQCDC
tara:strand:- start:699 stop:989 length:291 start_codon:yes stop_codon:yes gene_type:complete